MKNLSNDLKDCIGILLVCLVISSLCGIRSDFTRRPNPDNAPQTIPTVWGILPEFPSVYLRASIVSGCPEWILRGYDYAESSNGRNLNHPNPNDHGRFGINERFHAERAAKWGEYDPDNFYEAAVLAGRLYVENLALLGDVESAICAHVQGPTGVKRDGKNLNYLHKILSTRTI